MTKRTMQQTHDATLGAVIGDTDDIATLVERARDGDMTAVEAIYHRYKTRIYTLLIRMTGNESDAEELLQESFLLAFEGLASFQGRSRFYTWLYRIALNTAYKFLRKRKQHTVELRPEQIIGDSGSQITLQPILKRALTSLPIGYRTVLILYDIEGFEHSEIAEMLRISSGTSKSQLHKARKMMCQLLEPYMSDIRRHARVGGSKR